MDYRGVFLVVVAGGAALLAATTSCTAPDPGEVTFSERRSGASSGDNGGATPDSDGGGTLPGTDAGGGDGGTTPADPVFGTTTFAAGQPGTGAPANGAADPHAGNVEGKDCVQSGCHGSAGPSWAFGGTLYNAATGGTTVAGAEIRISGPDGKEYAKTYSDANGNFWVDKPVGVEIPANSRVGVRNATSQKVMSGTLSGASGAGCNATGCHAAAMRVFLN